MKRILILAMAFACLISTNADGREGRFRQRRLDRQTKPVAQDQQWWPWDIFNDDPTPEPDEPTPAPQPEPAPLPDDPDDVPEPKPDSPLPADAAALNEFVGKLLGGYVRANHERNGITLDVYQARGRQRIAWEVADCEDWMAAVGKASYLKKKTKADRAGLILICDQPTPVEPLPEPQPEPQPAPSPDQPTPQPAPDDGTVTPVTPPDEEPLPVPKPETDEEQVVYTCGGENLLDAQDACEGAGLWLVIVHRDTGTANRVIYAK